VAPLAREIAVFVLDSKEVLVKIIAVKTVE
jgi:hypothetical protein